ncbi:ATP-binding response regulator [Flavobacterium pedocola]
METNKPSYEELAQLVAELRERLRSLTASAQSQSDLDSPNKEKALADKAIKAELVAIFLQQIQLPLDTIIGVANLLSNPNLDFEQRNNFAEIIKSCTGELRGILSEFASYTTSQSEKETVNTQKVSLNELLDELKVKFIGQVLHNNLGLRFIKGLADREDAVMTDAAMISQIFTNLMNNSLRFTSKGYIEIGYQVEHNELIFYVKDTGIGLEKDLKDKLLRSDFKLDKVSDGAGSAGLGLSTAKHYLDLLGGSLHVQSEVGFGTVFSFKVPYQPVVDQTKSEAPRKTIKVLIAEDEEISYLLLKSLLEKGNVEIIRAKNGEEAYWIYKSNPDINLILMDLRMPQVDGYTAAQLIKNEAPEIPIIAQSAYVLDEDKGNYGKAFNDYLSKPINKKEFQQVLDKYIDVAFLN